MKPLSSSIFTVPNSNCSPYWILVYRHACAVQSCSCPSVSYEPAVLKRDWLYQRIKEEMVPGVEPASTINHFIRL